MPYHYSEEGIREYWGYCGEIESLDMMTFPDSGRFKGIVFITFASEEATAKALECNGEQLEGQTLKVGGRPGFRVLACSKLSVMALATTGPLRLLCLFSQCSEP